MKQFRRKPIAIDKMSKEEKAWHLLHIDLKIKKVEDVIKSYLRDHPNLDKVKQQLLELKEEKRMTP